MNGEYPVTGGEDQRNGSIYARVLDTLQDLEELGGVASTEEYVAIMRAVAAYCTASAERAIYEAQKRKDARALATGETPKLITSID